MKLYLVQHAEAMSKKEDPTRPISEEGKQNAEKMANYVSQVLHLEIDRILHSNKLRAKQTAAIFAKILHPPDGPEEVSELEPLANPSIWLEKLKKMDESVMLVGHLPHLCSLTSGLLTGDIEKEVVGFKNAGIAHIEQLKEDTWVLHWVLTPETISKKLTSGK